MHVSLAFVRNGNRCGSDRLRCGPTAQAHLPALQNCISRQQRRLRSGLCRGAQRVKPLLAQVFTADSKYLQFKPELRLICESTPTYKGYQTLQRCRFSLICDRSLDGISRI